MTRFVCALVMVGVLLLGVPNRAYCADVSSSGDSGFEEFCAEFVAEFAVELGKEAARFIAKAIWSEATKDLAQSKYTAKPVSVIQLPDKLGPCVSQPKSIEVVMQATEDGKPISTKDPLSKTVPYDPNARVYMTSRVKVEVVACYPIKDIRYADGKIMLPTNPQIVAGYLGKEGERSTWDYHGGAGWDADKQQAVARDLTLKALDVAREAYTQSQSSMEEELSRTFKNALDRLIREATKGSDRGKP